jgi:hypothetical protein
VDVDTRAGLSIGSAVTGGRYGNEPAIDFSRPLAPKVREPSPGAGRPGGVPFDDLFEVFETGDLVFPRCVRGRGVGEVPGYGELELSVTHSYMSRYKAAALLLVTDSPETEAAGGAGDRGLGRPGAGAHCQDARGGPRMLLIPST